MLYDQYSAICFPMVKLYTQVICVIELVRTRRSNKYLATMESLNCGKISNSFYHRSNVILHKFWRCFWLYDLWIHWQYQDKLGITEKVKV